ncbi:MAG: DUF4867 family protein [Eubacteriales bacterium]|nr:DUF4867 family protein [Eubacteriales bacterium]
MKIGNVNDAEFRQYGRVIEGIELNELIQTMNGTPLPSDVVYVPSDKALEALGIYDVMSKKVYGNMPVQIGYCNGHNQLLNGLEYHRDSEINVAVTDLILLLGRLQDIEEDYTYDTSKVKAFFVPAGTVIEVYATTLHYAPCGVDGQGFRCVVVLPRGTNYAVEPVSQSGEDKLLAAANKWLIAHKDAHIAGAFEGLKGENIRI